MLAGLFAGVPGMVLRSANQAEFAPAFHRPYFACTLQGPAIQPSGRPIAFPHGLDWVDARGVLASAIWLTGP